MNDVTESAASAEVTGARAQNMSMGQPKKALRKPARSPHPPVAPAQRQPRRKAPGRIRLMIAGRRTICREALKIALEGEAQEFNITLAGSLTEAQHMLDAGDKADLLLIYLTEAGDSCLVKMKEIRRQRPDLPFAASLPRDDNSVGRRIMEMGGEGIFPVGTNMGVLIAALRLVAAGGTYVPPFLLHAPARPHPDQGSNSGTDARFPTLTRRERDVLGFLAEGASNRQIADKLSLRESTVKAHMKQVLRKLGVHNRTEAALKARDPAS